MITTIRFGLPRIAGLALGFIATLLVGADSSIDSDFARLNLMPRGERQRLWSNLQRFDRLRPSDQQAVRELDRRISEISNPAQKAHYLGILRRYHLWFESLPESKRDELQRATPDDRMALVSRFMADDRLAAKAGPAHLLLRIADIGPFSPVDVAMIYKVWQGLGPAEKSGLETAPPLQLRNQLAKRGAQANVTEEGLLPSGYQEDDWVRAVEKRKRGLHVDQITKKVVVKDEIKKHLAVNLYFLENPPKSVSSANLVLFLSQLPSVVRSTFDTFPPDEAKRRLSIAYRLVFPEGEIPTVDPATKGLTTAPEKARSATGSAIGGAASPATKPAAGPTPKPGARSADLPF